MKKILAITKWEFFEKVRTKAFIISMILTPLLMVAMGFIPTLLMNKAETKAKKIAVVDQTNKIADKFISLLNSKYTLPDGTPNYLVAVEYKNSDMDINKIKSEMDNQVFKEKIENYIIINKTVFEDGKCEFRGTNVSNIKDVERFERTIKTAISEEVFAQRGVDPGILKEIEKPLNMKSVKIDEKGESKESGFLQTFFTSYIFIILLMLLIILTGQLLVRSLVEEKSNRIIEILVSSCSPTQLMAGKILGLSALGLTQIIVMILFGVGASMAFNVNLAISMENLALILVYFLLGYVLYAAVFVAIGSLASTEQEAQQLTSYISMLLVLPIMLAMTAVQDPNTSLIRILSFIPFLTPSFMVLRIPIITPPLWEIASTLLILILSIIGMVWVAGKIFRIGILMYGKAPNIKEIFKMLRTK
jgi:ABC-2 type transport system permease protein